MSWDEITDNDDYLAKLERLQKLWKDSGKPRKPKALHINEITTDTELFQPRDDTEGLLEYETHIETLTRVAKDGRNLEPIKVFPVGDDFFCIDGHCRLAAYEKALISRKVPVEVFKGDAYQAFAASIGGNSKDKLALSKEEKSQNAWRLVLLDRYSIAETAEISGRSESQIENMRKAKRQLEDAGESPESYSWQEVLKWQRGGVLDDDFDGWKERKAQKWADTIRGFAKPAAKNPDVFRLSFSKASKTLDKRLKAEYEEEIRGDIIAEMKEEGPEEWLKWNEDLF